MITRTELLIWLGRVVADNLITVDEATKAIDDFDAGLLQLDSLPLPLTTAIQGVDEALVNDALDLTS